MEEYIAKLEQEKQNLRSDPSYEKYAYVTHEDLKRLSFSKKGD